LREEVKPMDGNTFTRLLHGARMLQIAGVIGNDYFRGYQRGLRRLLHGKRFGSEAEHAHWLRMGLENDPEVELGNGYRDGFAGRDLCKVFASCDEAATEPQSSFA
jgi:hypothetical protein